MADLRTSVIVNLAGNLQSRARQFGASMQQFAQSGNKHLSSLQRSTALLGRGIDRLGNRYTAFLTGAGAAGALKYVSNLETRLTRLGIIAEADAEAISNLKNEMFAIANAPNVRVDPSEILDAIEIINTKTGDLSFARANIENVGVLISAFGASGRDIGAFIAEFQKVGEVDPKKIFETMDALNLQGKLGGFEMRDMAASGERLVQAYAAMGRSGPAAMKELGATMQVIRQGTGSSEEAVTSFERLLDTFTDNEKLKTLKASGIEVFVPGSDEVLRPINELMVEIAQMSQGRKTILSQLFDIRALRAFNVVGAQLKRDGIIDVFDKFIEVSADGTATLNDAATAAGTSGQAMTTIYTSLKRAADKSLAKPLKDFADALNSMDPERLDAIVDRVIKIGAVVGGIVLGAKLIKGGIGLVGAFRGAGGALGSAAGGMTPVPVIIVGGLPGMMGGRGGVTHPTRGGVGTPFPVLDGAGGGQVAKRGGRLMNMLKGGGRALGPLGALIGTGLLASTWMDKESSTTDKITGSTGIVGGTAGAIGGMKAGALAGGALGSFVPIIGTAAGAVAGGILGSILGGLGGEWLGRKSAEHLTAADIGREVAKSLDNQPLQVDANIRADGTSTVMTRRGRRRTVQHLNPGQMMATP